MSGAGWVIVTGLALLAIGSAIMPLLGIVDGIRGRIRPPTAVALVFDLVVAPLIFVGAITAFGGAMVALWKLVAP